MIGSLLYLTCTRLEIMHVIGNIKWFQENIKEMHLHEVKIIFKCLWGTQYFGLCYPKNAYLSLHACKTAGWESNIDDHNSTSGGEFSLGPHLVSWFIKKQGSIYLSTAKQDMLLFHLAVLKFYGWSKHYNTFKSFILNLHLFLVTILVPYIYLRILSCTKKPSTFQWNIILCENRCLNKRSN